MLTPLFRGGVQMMGMAGGAGNGLLNNLVAYWALDEAAGANDALDLHTNGLTLTQVHSPGSDTGKVYAGARTFDGVNDYFTRNSETLLKTGDVDFTAAAWVYLKSTAGSRDIIGHYLSIGSLRSWLLRYEGTSSRFRCFISSDGGYVDGVTATDLLANTFGAASLDVWYFVAFRHDSVANTITITVNDKSDSKAWTAGSHVSTAPFQIARQNIAASSNFDGRIGASAFWKSAAGGGGVLSAAKIAALYNAGNGLAYASFTA